MRNTLIFLGFLFAFKMQGNAQKLHKKIEVKKTDIESKANEKAKIIKKNFLSLNNSRPTKILALSATANSSGWTGGIHYLKINSRQRLTGYSISFSEIKHDKELKLKSNSYEIVGYGKPITYIYGKQNSFYTLNLGIEKNYLILSGLLENNTNISLIGGANISIGILKPYYLKIKHTDSNGSINIKNETYNSINIDTLLNTSLIYSRSEFKVGFNESKIIPGLSAFIGAQVELGKQGAFYKAIRFGASFSAFSQKIPLMIQNKSHFYNAQLFLGILVGKAW